MTYTDKELALMQAVDNCRGRPIKDVCAALGIQHNQLSRMLGRLSREVTKRVGPSRKAGGILVLTDVGAQAIGRTVAHVQSAPTPKPKAAKPKAEKTVDPQVRAWRDAVYECHKRFVLDLTGIEPEQSAQANVGYQTLAGNLRKIHADAQDPRSPDQFAEAFYANLRAVCNLDGFVATNAIKAQWVAGNITRIIATLKAKHHEQSKPQTKVERAHDATVAELRRRAASGQLG